MVEKRKDKPCNHEESINFLCQDNPSYFTTTYIKGNKSWPRSCFHCSIEFGSGYKVNNKHPVMMFEMLQSMIMNVCVQCVFIVTTKCKAMRNIHLEEQDDQETSNLFYLYMFLYFITPIYFRPSFNNKRKIVTTRKKTFTFGKI